MPIMNVNDISLNYLDEGQGEPLLLIHNLTSNIAGFLYNIPELSKHYRVLAPDHRGHGGTSRQPDPEQAADFYDFEYIVDDILAFLDAKGIDRFYLFGQAYWGVSIAMFLYQRIPSRIKGIALSATHMISTPAGVKSHETLSEQARRNFEHMHKLALEQGMEAVYQARIESGQFWSQVILDSEALLAIFRQAHLQTCPNAFVYIPHFSNDKKAAIIAELERNNTPVMLLLGESDSHNAAAKKHMRADYPACHIMIIPDAGHYPTIENPKDFNRALLNFLAGLRLEEREVSG